MRTNLAVILEKVTSSHSNLDRSAYTGWLTDRPKVGERLVMNTREADQLVTTPVKTVRFVSDSEVEVDTTNSTYRLTYIKEGAGETICLTSSEREVLEVLTKQGFTSNLAIIGFLRLLEMKLRGKNER